MSERNSDITRSGCKCITRQGVSLIQLLGDKSMSLTNKHSPAVGLIGLVLYPLSAYASFNSFGNSPLCSNVDCALWIGGSVGIVGVPVSVLIFWALSLISRRRRGWNAGRTWWVITNGAVAYMITIAVLLLGPARNVTWAYVYIAYGALFSMASYFVGHKLPR
jgi:hypothetical protein